MPSDFKCVFNFFSTGKKGGTWSEVWYRSANDLNSAVQFSQRLINLRLDLLHPINILSKIRVSQVGSPRITSIVNVQKNGYQFAPTTPAPIDSAIVCTLSSSAHAATRRWWLRGWDASFAKRDSDSGNDTFSAGCINGVKNFLTEAAASSFEILPLVKSSVGGFAYIAVTKVDGTAANGTSVLTLAAAPPGGLPMQVILGRFSKKDLPGLNGTYTVLAAGALSVTIPYSTPENQMIASPDGRLRLLGYLSGAVIDPTISGPSFIGSRQTKSPFTGSRGARSANRRLRLSP